MKITDLGNYRKVAILIIFFSGVLSTILFSSGPLLSHFELLAPLKGLRLLILGGKIGLLNVVITLFSIVFFRAKSQNIKPFLWTSLPGLIVSLVLLLLFLQAKEYPPINDITTTPEDPPQFQKVLDLAENKGKDMVYPANFAVIQKKAYPDISPQVMEMDPDRLFTKVQEAAHQMNGWEIVSEDPGAKTLEAVATTYLFYFKDDVIIQIRSMDTGSAVHMRSKSRVGIGDIGANARRIRLFFSVLKDVKKKD